MSYHILLVSFPAWGHVRPLLALAVRLVIERDDIILTILVPPNMLDRGFTDLECHFAHEGMQNAAKRVRLLTTLVPDPKDPIFAILAKSGQAYPSFYKRLVAGETITCAARGTVFDPVPAPVAIVMSLFSLNELRATREITGDKVPVSAIVASGAAPIIRLFGPESIGGFGDMGPRIDAEAGRTGRDPVAIGEEIYFSTKGVPFKVAGLPEMYDYESFPQKFTPFGPISVAARSGYSFLAEAEGLILTSSEAYEVSGSLKALRDYRSANKKSTFAVGPALPLGYSLGNVSNRGDDAVTAFLDDKLDRFGEKSVLFMSFGSIMWPESLDYVEDILDCMIAKQLPFIFAPATLPEAMVAKVEASGLGYLSKWAPQQYILTHPATGWSLTHCGWGGVTEALGAGVPMIAWPFTNDQPFNAAHLSENLQVAIELIEVRTDKNGLKPMRRHGRTATGTREAVREEFLGVIDDIRGPKGAKLRENAERMRGKYAAAWESDGDARLELRAFLDKFVLKH